MFTLLLSIYLLFAPSFMSSIKGRVVDARTGRPLAGAEIMIVDGEQGAKSNEFGNFLIRSVLPGDYDLICGYPEYQRLTLKGIRVRMDISPTVVFALRRHSDVLDTGYFAVPPPALVDSVKSLPQAVPAIDSSRTR